MNRPWQGRVNDATIEGIKNALPEAVLRTTFIVGFPGETDRHFEHLMEFVRRHEFDHVGVFTFSPEEETPAYSLPNQLPQKVMDERRTALMELQQPISWQKNQQEIGKIVDVLIEQENAQTGELIGRSTRFAPEVDGLVYVRKSANLKSSGGSIISAEKVRLGSIVRVAITDADPYDLYGDFINS